MSNFYDADISKEVVELLYKQETFVISKRWYSTQLVTGGDLPAILQIGTLKPYLDHSGYVKADADVHVNLVDGDLVKYNDRLITSYSE